MLLAFPEDRAGGFMTTEFVRADRADRVADRPRPARRATRERVVDLDRVIVVDADGRLVDEVTLLELFLAAPDAAVGSLCAPPWPIAVALDAPLAGGDRPVHGQPRLVGRRRRRGAAARRPHPRRRPRRRAGRALAPAPAAAGTAHDGRARARLASRRRRRRLVGALALVGPGLIAANAGNDAGGIATYASAGSEYVYRTLSFMVLVTVALIVVQEMSARLGAYTGEGLVSLIREQFPLRVAAFAVACLLVANLGLVVSEFAGIGAALELFGVSRFITIPVGGRADLEPRRARLVPLGRADLPAPQPRVPLLPRGRSPRPSRLGRGCPPDVSHRTGSRARGSCSSASR